MTTTSPQFSVVIPAYNEASNVAPLAARVIESVQPLGSFELILVDDGSTDATLAEIRQLAGRDPRVRYLSFTRNFGHQAALRAGLRHARGATAILMDCDFEHPPELIPELVAAWRHGAKIVVTERAVPLPDQVSWVKRETSRWFYRLLNAIGDVRISAGSADFLLLDRIAIDTINRFESPEIFLRGIVRWLGYPLQIVPYAQGVRHAGKSKFTFRRMVNLALMGIVTHSIKPLRIAIYLSFAFALLGVLLLVYSVFSFFFIDQTVPGWSSIIAAVALLGAGQLLILGIIGEYVSHILRESRGWPVYLIAETDAAGPPAPAEPVSDGLRERTPAQSRT